MTLNTRGMDGSQKYRVNWKTRVEHFQATFVDFIDNQVHCDITLVGEGQSFKAHQFVLSACSSYFKNILQDVRPSQHPIIFLRGVAALEIQGILDYMYKGEAVISCDMLPRFLETCESLHIQELCDEQNSTGTDRTENQRKSSNTESISKFSIRSTSQAKKSPTKNKDCNTKRRNNNNDDQYIQSKQAKLQNSSGVPDILQESYPSQSASQTSPNKNLEHERPSFNELTRAVSQDKVHSLSSVSNETQVSSPQSVFHVSPTKNLERITPSLNDLTQPGVLANESSDETCFNNSVIETDIIKSPSESQQSIVFSIRAPLNTTSESVLILSHENPEVFEVSDDDSVICANKTVDKEPSKPDNEDVRKKAQMGFLQSLNLQANLQESEAEDSFTLELSPSSDIASDDQCSETYDSEEIIRSRSIKMRFGTPFLENSNDGSEAHTADTIMKDNQWDKQLKIVLSQLPEIEETVSPLIEKNTDICPAKTRRKTRSISLAQYTEKDSENDSNIVASVSNIPSEALEEGSPATKDHNLSNKILRQRKK